MPKDIGGGPTTLDTTNQGVDEYTVEKTKAEPQYESFVDTQTEMAGPKTQTFGQQFEAANRIRDYYTDPTVKAKLFHKVEAFSPYVIDTAPSLVQSLITSKLDSQQVRQVAKAYNSALPYVNRVTGLGGQDGLLAPAMNYALLSGNKEGLEFLGKVSKLNPGDQQILLSYLYNGPDVAQAQYGAEGDVGLKASELLSETIPGAEFGYANDKTGKQMAYVQFANANASQDTSIALRQLFPGLQTTIGSGNTGFDEALQAFEPIDLRHPSSLYKAPIYNALKITDVALLKPTGMAFQAGLDTVFNFSKWVAGGVYSDNDVAKNQAFHNLETFQGGIGKVFEGIDYVTDQASSVALQAAGFSEDDPHFTEARDTMSGLLQFFLFDKAEKFGQGMRIGAESGALGGEALLNIDKPFRQHIAQDTALGRFGVYEKAPFLTNPAFHLPEFSKYISKKLGFNLRNQPLEKAVYEYEPLQDVFSRIEAVKNEVGYRQGGDPVLRAEVITRIERMGGDRVPSKLIERLVDAPRNLMEQAFVDHVNEAGILGKDLIEVKEDLVRLRAEAKETGTDAWDAKNAEAVRAAEQELSATVSEVRRNLGARQTVGEGLQAKANEILGLPNEIEIPADVAKGLLEFPKRGAKGPRPAGEPTTGGPITIEYDPATGKGIISEGMHRVNQPEQAGVLNENGTITAEVKIVDTATINREGATMKGTEAQELPQELRDAIEGKTSATDETLGEYINEIGQNPEKMFADMPETAARMREGLKTYYDLARERNAAATEHAVKVLEVKAQEALAADLAGVDLGVPVYKYPRIGGVSLGKYFGFKSFSNRAAMLEPVTSLETTLHTMYGWFARRGVDIAETVNELPKRPPVYDPSAVDKPLNWQESNAHNVTYYLRTAGVPDDIAVRLSAKLAEVTGKQEFFEWFKEFHSTVGDWLPKDIDPSVRHALTHFGDTAMEQRTLYNHPDGESVLSHGVENPATGKLDEIPTPSDPTEFMSNSVTLGDVDLLTQATGTINGFMSRFRNTKGVSIEVPRAVRDKLGMKNNRVSLADPAYYGVKAILATSTAAFKPLVLLLGLPRMISRISIEQVMRVHLYGGYKGVLIGPGGVPVTPEASAYIADDMRAKGEPLTEPAPDHPGFRKPTYADVGSIHDELTEGLSEKGYITEKTGDYTRGNRNPKRAVFHGWVNEIQALKASQVSMEMLRQGMDAPAFREWMKNNMDNPFVRKWVQDQEGLLFDERSNIIREIGKGDITDPVYQDKVWTRFIERKMEAVRDILRDDPVLMEGLRNGKILPDGAMERPNTDFVTGESLTAKYGHTLEKLDMVSKRISEIRKEAMIASNAEVASDRWSEYRALSESRRNMLIEAYDMRNELGIKGVTDAGKAAIKISDTSAMARYLHDTWDQGLLELPGEVKVKKTLTYSDRSGFFEKAAHMRSGMSAGMYKPFRAVSWADLKLTRGSLWRQIADESYRNLRSRGYSTTDARAYAQLRAGEITRDVMYDLAARTSLHRKMKDIFWFAPATQEIAYTWGIKLPAQSGWPIGALSILGKANALVNILEGTGLIHKDENGEWVYNVPGMDGFVSKLSGFNFVASGKSIGPVPVPGLSTLPSWWLSKEAKAHGGAFKTLSDLFVFQGAGDPQVVPQQINYLWESLTGHRSPLEFLSPDASKQQYDRSMDLSIRFAFMELQDKGVLPPRPEDFETPLAYHDARDAYSQTLMDGAMDHFKGVAFHKLLGSTVAPSQMYENSPEATAYRAFYTKNIEPLFKPDATGYTEQQKKLLDGYLADHPNSLAYSISYYAPGEKVRDLAYESTPSSEYYDKLYTGELKVLEPEDYVNFLAAMASQRYYLGQQSAALRAISPKLDPAELMRNNYQRSQAALTYRENWNKYLDANPEAKAIVEDKQEYYVKKYGIEPETFEAQRYGDLIAGVNSVAKYFTGESGMRSDELRTVLGELKQLYSENSTFGVPTTKMGKGISAYMDQVVIPYYDATGPIYDKINAANSAGLPTDELYSQLDKVKQQYSGKDVRTINGEVYPTPEQFTFGSKKPAEREFAVANWSTKPAYWLSGFQLDKVGYEKFDGRNQMLSEFGRLEDQFYQTVADREASPASKEYDYYRHWTDREEERLARTYGKDGVNLLTLTKSVPAQRISLLNDNVNPTFARLAGQAQEVANLLTQHGMSPRSYSKAALYYKQWFLGQVQVAMADPDFRDAMQRYSYAIPEDDNLQKEGVPLVEALFFGQFSSQYIPADYLIQGEGI